MRKVFWITFQDNSKGQIFTGQEKLIEMANHYNFDIVDLVENGQALLTEIVEVNEIKEETIFNVVGYISKMDFKSENSIDEFVTWYKNRNNLCDLHGFN